MLEITPQERLALSVTAILLAAGVGARVLADSDLEGAPDFTVAGAADERAPPTAAARERAEEERIRTRPLADGERIDPNVASVLELQRLPRIGAALAGRIVAHREANGAFRTLGDLDLVPGVGPALLAGLAPLVTLPPPPPDQPHTNGIDVTPGPGSAGPPLPAGGSQRPIDINRASTAELEALPGIGPAIALRIVQWRHANGPFQEAADLEKVPGIGPRLRERLEPRIRIGY